jgi:hypothetical protein
VPVAVRIDDFQPAATDRTTEESLEDRVHRARLSPASPTLPSLRAAVARRAPDLDVSPEFAVPSRG